MSFLGINWDDLSGRKARRKLQHIEEQEQLRLQEEESKPYLKTYFSNGIVTVVFKDGTVVSTEGNEELFKVVTDSWIGEEGIRIVLNKAERNRQGVEERVQNDVKLLEYDQEVLDILGQDFSNDNRGFYYKDISLPIPGIVLESMVEYKKQENTDMFERMVYFFLLLATSPIEACRENVLRFCKKNDVRISKRGNIIAYRRVVKIEEDTELRTFVKESYTKVKKHKKKPLNYDVWISTDDQGFREIVYIKHDKTPKPDGTTWKHEGNLLGLAQEFEKVTEQLYTSWHNKGKYTFKIGDIYKLDGEEPDPNTGNCSSKGLHCGSTSFGFSGFGDTGVCVLVNPSRSIFVPESESNKFRTTEMKIAILHEESNTHIDEALIEEADKEYADYTIEGLTNALRNKSFGTFSVKEEVPVINLLDLKTIQESLKNRVVTV